MILLVSLLMWFSENENLENPKGKPINKKKKKKTMKFCGFLNFQDKVCMKKKLKSSKKVGKF